MLALNKPLQKVQRHKVDPQSLIILLEILNQIGPKLLPQFGLRLVLISVQVINYHFNTARFLRININLK